MVDQGAMCQYYDDGHAAEWPIVEFEDWCAEWEPLTIKAKEQGNE